MIAHLSGTIIMKKGAYVVLDVAGVGYKVYVTKDALVPLAEGGNVAFFTHLAVRENALDVYGFSRQDDLYFFEKLIGVSGIGPKSALAIMNLAPTATLRAAIVNGDSAYLTKVSGIGGKTAQKILLELRDSFGKEETTDSYATRDEADALEALMALGYRERVAREALKEIGTEIIGINDRVKAALTLLGSSRAR